MRGFSDAARLRCVERLTHGSRHDIVALDAERHEAAVAFHQCLVALAAVPVTVAFLHAIARLAEQSARLIRGASKALTVAVLTVDCSAFLTAIGLARGSSETTGKVALAR